MSLQSSIGIEEILHQIDQGQLDPGDVIAEDALQLQLNISRTPIREALLKLEANGLVQRLPRKGTIVFKPTLEEFLSILEATDCHARPNASLPRARCLTAQRPKSPSHSNATGRR